MKSPTKVNQAKNLAAAVFTGLRGLGGLVSKWNREPNAQNDDRIAVNSLYSRRKKPRQNTGPDHF